MASQGGADGILVRQGPSDPFSQDVWEALSGGQGQQNIAARGVGLPQKPYRPGRAGSSPTEDGLDANLDCQLIEIKVKPTTAAPTADQEVPHGLGRVPRGFIQVACDQAGVLVFGHPNPEETGGNVANSASWTREALFLRSVSVLAGHAAEATVRLLVF